MLDPKGRVVGEPFQVPDFGGAKSGIAALAKGVGGFDIVRLFASFELAADAAGWVQRGCVVPATDAPGATAIPVSTRGSAVARLWVEQDREPASRDRALRLLRSSRTGDRFRALHEIERLGTEAAPLAALLPALFDCAGENPVWLADRAVEILEAQKTEDIKPLVPRLLELWGTLSEYVSLSRCDALVSLLARLQEERCDELLAGILERFGEDKRFVPGILRGFLNRPPPRDKEKVLAAAARLASLSEPVDPDIPWIDWQLSAHWLLIHWGAPGAVERLLAKLREPDNTWLFDPGWKTSMPPTFAPALKILAAERPERYWGQVAELLAPEEE